jgi:MFS family permease
MVPYVVDKRVIGTVYGIALCFQSIGPIFGPLIVGRILDTTSDLITKYYRVNLFLASAAALALVLNIILMIVDKRTGGILMASNKDQKKIKEVQTEDSNT